MAPPTWTREHCCGGAGLYDALVIHFRDHPGLGEKPEPPGLYRTSFDPREACEWCSKGQRVVDLRNAQKDDSTIQLFQRFSAFKVPPESALRGEVDVVSINTRSLERLLSRPVDQRRNDSARKTHENMRRRPPRRI